MNRYLALVLAFFCYTVGFAQTGSIQGKVLSSDNQPVELVNVIVKGTTRGATSDKNGAYTIKNLAEGSYTLKVTVVGLQTNEKTVNVKAGTVTSLDFILTENAAQLNEVVVTGNTEKYKKNNPSQSLRLSSSLLETPQNIQVVTGQLLKDQQVISMSDGLVRNVSGLVRAEHWGDMYTNITARGSQIQAFRNGFNVVNSYWGPLTEDMSFVESIEFVKGPAGFMLSSGDPSGLYNVVTKKPTGVTKGEATMTVGSFDLYRTTLDLDGKLSKNGKLLYRLNLAAQNKKSFRANEYNNRYVIAPVVSYQLDDQTKLTLEYNYQRADMSNVGSYYVFAPDSFATLPADFTSLPANTPGTKINDHSVYLNLQHNLSKNWKVTVQVARFMYNQEGTSMWPTEVRADGTMIRNIGIWDARSRMNMAQAFVNGTVKTGPVQHKILAGIDMATKDYLADWGQSHDLDDSANAFNPADPNLGLPSNGYPQFDRETPLAERAQASGGLQDQAYTSVYVQDELGFFENRVRLTLAARYTDLKQSYYTGIPDKAQHFTPRAGLSVSIDKSTAVYGLYDQAFVPQTGLLSNGNKVQPITGNNTEVGIKRDWFGGRWNTTLAAYRILKNNELIADPNAAPALGLSIELGQKLSEGIEFDLRGYIVPGLSLVANYAYTNSKVLKVAEGVTSLKEGDIIPGFASHTANTWLTYRVQNGLLKGFGISAGATALLDRHTYWEVSPNPAVKLADYYKVDGGISWEGDKLYINANVFNVLDAYLYSGSYYSYLSAYYWQAEAPRNYRLTIGYKF